MRTIRIATLCASLMLAATTSHGQSQDNEQVRLFHNLPATICSSEKNIQSLVTADHDEGIDQATDLFNSYQAKGECDSGLISGAQYGELVLTVSKQEGDKQTVYVIFRSKVQVLNNTLLDPPKDQFVLFIYSLRPQPPERQTERQI